MEDPTLKTASRELLEHWVGMAGRSTLLELRDLEAQLRRQWSAESLAPATEAIEARRRELEHPALVPVCVECGGPCDKPFGWFVVERWERGRAVRRGSACGVGCLIATAHSQRHNSVVPTTRGVLLPIEDRMVEGVEEHGAG